MATVIWTSEALTNLAGIRAYIDQFSPLNAQRFSAKLAGAVETLAENPNRGRLVRGGRREFTAIWPYVVRYRVSGDEVLVLRIRHGARLNR